MSTTRQTSSRPGRTRVNLGVADARIRSMNVGATFDSFEAIFRECHIRDFDHYWQMALSLPSNARKLSFLLETHLLTPEIAASEMRHRSQVTTLFVIEAALKEALSVRPPWAVGAVVPGNPLSQTIRPMDAVRALAENQIYRDILPESLLEAISAPLKPPAAAGKLAPPEKPAKAKQTRPARKRGRTETVAPLVRAQMREMDLSVVSDMFDTELEETFKCSAYTANKVLAELLAEAKAK